MIDDCGLLMENHWDKLWLLGVFLGDSAPQQSSFYVCSHLGEKLGKSKVYPETFSLHSLGMTQNSQIVR